VDCSRTINPDGVSNQVEGGIVQAVSWVLKAAIANAVFDAIGVRVRDLPLTRERMLTAITDA